MNHINIIHKKNSGTINTSQTMVGDGLMFHDYSSLVFCCVSILLLQVVTALMTEKQANPMIAL